MIPLYKTWLIQIEITNACTFKCANCTRFVGHHPKPYFMELEKIEEAVDSLAGYHGGVGIMGGEPTLHPRFPEICDMLMRKLSPYQCGLWTSGYKWDEYKKLIKKTFKFAVNYNDHSDTRQKHQPVLVAIDEVVKNKESMWDLINHCWVQELWSPSINVNGAFFCEVAAAMDMLLGLGGGYPVKKGWWAKDPADFRDQIELYCRHCGAALPFECPSNKEAKDMVSPGNLALLKKTGSPKIKNGRYEIFDRPMDEGIEKIRKNWIPNNYLGLSPVVKKVSVFKYFIRFFGDFRRKRNLKPDELWLLNRGSNSLYRLWHKTKRRFFEKPPVKSLPDVKKP
jgi:hypothetical protein